MDLAYLKDVHLGVSVRFFCLAENKLITDTMQDIFH